MLKLPYEWRAPPTDHLKFDWSYSPITDGNFSLFLGTVPDFNILLDAHSHTTHSDGSMSVKQNLEWHIANGYNAAFITDHNDIGGAQEAAQIAAEDESLRDKIIILTGTEWSHCRGHYNLLFPSHMMKYMRYDETAGRDGFPAIVGLAGDVVASIVPFPTDG